jgi:hypothetical protein
MDDDLSFPCADDSKYATFPRDRLILVTDGFMTFRTDDEIWDAVVIRRQDLFASPCLFAYSAMISIVAKNHSNPEVAKELQVIADYFHAQAVLAGEEGYKLPTL